MGLCTQISSYRCRSQVLGRGPMRTDQGDEATSWGDGEGWGGRGVNTRMLTITS